jgi:protein tyrosine phosphatase
MKMLMLVSRDFLEDTIVDALMECDITQYTIVPRSLGVGETGTVTSGFKLTPVKNIVIFAAATEQQTDLAIKIFKNLRAQKLTAQKGKPFPLRMFCLPCEQIL